MDNQKYRCTNVKFDADIHRQIKQYCAQDGGRTMKSLIQEAVLAHIRAVKPQGAERVYYSPLSEMIDAYDTTFGVSKNGNQKPRKSQAKTLYPDCGA